MSRKSHCRSTTAVISAVLYAASPAWSSNKETPSAWREKFYPSTTPFSAPHSDDLAEDFVDYLLYWSLEEISEAGLESARLAHSPWTDHYWPYYSGVIGSRYLDPNFPDSKNFLDYEKYLKKTIGRLEPWQFSPAEKYDLLVGDPYFSLTRTMLGSGRTIYDRHGEVESWKGLCYGWSAAAMMLPRPAHSVTVLAVDGQTWIEFLPSDIKALGSLLWNLDRFPGRMMGWRCSTRTPTEDPPGRPEQPNCLDTNPGTWHLAVVNQIGVGQRSFAMDIDYTYEVWNQPVFGYQYRYFNPKTGYLVDSLKSARVSLRDMPEDKYARFRSPRAVSVVGIQMDVAYVYEANPSAAKFDYETDDKTFTVQFTYDLELDSNGLIIGGEWYSKAHPDFLWIPARNARATSLGDPYLSSNSRWKEYFPLPQEWAATARWTSTYGEPLAAIVETLFKRAHHYRPVRHIE